MSEDMFQVCQNYRLGNTLFPELHVRFPWALLSLWVQKLLLP